MSKFLILFLFTLISCGDTPPVTPSDAIGETKIYEPLEVKEYDRTHYEEICEALASKAGVLRTIIGSSTSMSYSFNYSEKGCSESSLSDTEVIKTKIVQGSSDKDFFFKRTSDGEYFSFRNVETNNSGMMADICKTIEEGKAALMNPMKNSDGDVIWYTWSVPDDYCQADANHECLYIQYGSKVKDKEYKIHTTEIIKFGIRQFRGYFLERRYISRANCSDRKTFEKMAVMLNN